MKNNNIILSLILVAILVVATSAVASLVKKDNPKKWEANDKDTNNKWATKTSNGQISVDLTPLNFENGYLVVDSRFNTHSGDLAEYNLLEMVRLNANGQAIKPVEVPKLSWHHGGGNFKFKLDNLPEQFSITIKDLPDVDERKFNWP